ncbi:hypothetical protein ACJJTC_011667 [Scirpophaga incertulas]
MWDMSGASSSVSVINNNVFEEFIKVANQKQLQNCQLLKHQPDLDRFGMHYLSFNYINENDMNKFLNEIVPLFTKQVIDLIECETREQHKSNLWHELRYARITTSKAFDVSRCKTSDGSLIAYIMGARTPDTPAMKRGRRLEDLVRTTIEVEYGKIECCGLVISQTYPMLAASPDGILNNDTIIEIKCPSSENTFKNYINTKNITAKFNAQVQLQMFALGFKKCLFCVADSDFENNKRVEVVKVDYDEQFINTIMRTLVNFWETNIFPLLYKIKLDK